MERPDGRSRLTARLDAGRPKSEPQRIPIRRQSRGDKSIAGTWRLAPNWEASLFFYPRFVFNSYFCRVGDAKLAMSSWLAVSVKEAATWAPHTVTVFFQKNRFFE